MIRRRGVWPAWLFRPPSVSDAGFFLLTLTLSLIPWGNAAVVPGSLLREIAARLAPGLLYLFDFLPVGLSLTILIGAACVLCGTLQAAQAVRHCSPRSLLEAAGDVGPFLLLLAVAVIQRPVDPARQQGAIAGMTGAFAVAASGYLFCSAKNHSMTRLAGLVRVCTISCAVAGAIRLCSPDTRPLFDAGSVNPLAVPLGVTLALGEARILTRTLSTWDMVPLTVVALETGWMHPAAALLITGIPVLIAAARAMRSRSRQKVFPPGQALILLGITLFAAAFQAETLASTVRDVSTWGQHAVALATDAGWFGMGPGMAAAMLRPDDHRYHPGRLSSRWSWDWSACARMDGCGSCCSDDPAGPWIGRGHGPRATRSWLCFRPRCSCPYLRRCSSSPRRSCFSLSRGTPRARRDMSCPPVRPRALFSG
ncbi:MAG TPA: hypothetical protein PKX28_05730 [Candidatus Hydrogenedentes bacterium]|nr:hypothetical protein [Candidatus Hydrogenedentota bacterium]